MKKNINSACAVSVNLHIEKSFAPKPLSVKGFGFLEKNTGKIQSMKFVDYRPPKIIKTATAWYVEYYFRVPDALAQKYKGKWKRFRVYEDINRHKSEEYNTILSGSVLYALDNGYNPFADELKYIVSPESAASTSLNTCLDAFNNYLAGNGLRKKTLQTYGTCINMMRTYFLTDNVIYRPIIEINQSKIIAFLNHYRVKNKWVNLTYNKNLRQIKMVFAWIVKQKYITVSPVTGVDRMKKQKASKNKYYPDDLAKKIKSKIEKADTMLYRFVQFSYYTCLRPQSESRLLRCSSIIFERNQIFIPAHVSKGNTDDYIPLSSELKTILVEMGVDKAPGDFYVFGVNGMPAAKPVGSNYFASKYKPFKDAFKLSDDYTLYGWKHTRVIHMKSDGATDAEIMQLTRHKDYVSFSHYLRDLGLTISGNIDSVTRKF